MRQLHLGHESSEEEGTTSKMNTILVVKFRPEEYVQKVHQVDISMIKTYWKPLVCRVSNNMLNTI